MVNDLVNKTDLERGKVSLMCTGRSSAGDLTSRESKGRPR